MNGKISPIVTELPLLPQAASAIVDTAVANNATTLRRWNRCGAMCVCSLLAMGYGVLLVAGLAEVWPRKMAPRSSPAISAVGPLT